VAPGETREPRPTVHRVVSDRALRAPPYSSVQEREYRAIVARIVRDRPGPVLDWGCGYGYVSSMLREKGVDVTPYEYIADLGRSDGLGLNRFYPGLEVWVSADPVALPFESGSFGAVLSCGVLEHVKDPHKSLDEIGRVLARGGTFYVYKLPNRYSYVERLAKLVGAPHHGDERFFGHLYSKSSATQLLADHGFEVREFRRANLLPLNKAGFLAPRASPSIWAMNRFLARVPGLNLVATDLELIATAPH
jgi:SAM-dependent methyltransferase